MAAGNPNAPQRELTAYERYEEERADHERVKREEREFDLAVKRGEYVARASVQQASATALALMTQSLRSISDNLELKLGLDPKVCEAVSGEIDQALAALSKTLQGLAGG